jgi:cobalt/nickel transport protein
MRGIPTRVVLVGLLLVAVVLAGVVSFYASSSPDGLERVAGDHGFLDSADEHAAAEAPLADYQAKGVEDGRMSGGLAGVAGALVVLVLAGGLTFALRRRGADTDDVVPVPADRH